MFTSEFISESCWIFIGFVVEATVVVAEVAGLAATAELVTCGVVLDVRGVMRGFIKLIPALVVYTDFPDSLNFFKFASILVCLLAACSVGLLELVVVVKGENVFGTRIEEFDSTAVADVCLLLLFVGWGVCWVLITVGWAVVEVELGAECFSNNNEY